MNITIFVYENKMIMCIRITSDAYFIYFLTGSFKMPKCCCIIGCNSSINKENLSFYSIPGVYKNQGEATERLSKERRNLWINRIRRLHAPTKYWKVCSKHFKSGMLTSNSCKWKLTKE